MIAQSHVQGASQEFVGWGSVKLAYLSHSIVLSPSKQPIS